jgi:hypothetical protein
MNGFAQEQKQELAAAGVPSKTVEDLERAANALDLPTKPTKDSWKPTSSRLRPSTGRRSSWALAFAAEAG